jgi:hypothetical protein
MVPVHETDVAEERWAKLDWENYELWEKVEQRKRRIKRLWIFSTGFIFLVLSSIPIIIDRLPKWSTRRLSQRLAQELNQVKKQASIHQSAYRFQFVGADHTNYVVTKINDCDAEQGEVAWSGALVNEESKEIWLSPEQGLNLGIPGLTDQFCYDPLLGAAVAENEDTLAGFGFIPVRDLSEKRTDRVSILLVSGELGEFTFD